jgi:hypothetical protein
VPTVHDQLLELQKLGRDGFLKQSTVPVLIELPPGPAQSHDDFLTRPLDGPLLRATVEATSAPAPRPRRLPDEAVVHFIRKRPKAAFQDRIGVGRTGNNDIVLPYAGVSKYHAYFTRSPEGWTLSDAGSRNGTFAGRDRLEPSEARPLDDEHLVRIGPHAFLFLTPPALVAFLEAR